MLRPIRRIALLLVLFFLGACSARGGGAYAAEGASVRVRNQSTSEMTIYAVASTQRIRIGRVIGLGTEVLRIPRAMIGGGREISFIASPLGGRPAGSFSMYVTPGEEVEITIPPTVR